MAHESANQTFAQIAYLSPFAPSTLSAGAASPTDIPERADSRPAPTDRKILVRRYRDARTLAFSSIFPRRLLPAKRVHLRLGILPYLYTSNWPDLKHVDCEEKQWSFKPCDRPAEVFEDWYSLGN